MSSKNGCWKSEAAGPTGSEGSVMITSYVTVFSARYLNPSPMMTLMRASERWEDMCGRNCFETHTTACGGESG